MEEFLIDFSNAAVELQGITPGYKSNRGRKTQFADGLTCYPEPNFVKMVSDYLTKNKSDMYELHAELNKEKTIELGFKDYINLLGGQTRLDLYLKILNSDIKSMMEFKYVSPLGDNGLRQDTWYGKVFDSTMNNSMISDVKRLYRYQSGDVQKWVVGIGLERRDEDQYNLDNVFLKDFRLLCKHPILEEIRIVTDLGDTHKHHQVMKLYAFRF